MHVQTVARLKPCPTYTYRLVAQGFIPTKPEYTPSFPLNRTRWFGADVIHYPVYALHLVNDAVGDGAQRLVRYAAPIGGHEIGCFNGADGNDVFVAPFISHYPYGAERQEYGKALGNGAVEACLSYLFDNNLVGIAEDFQARPCHLTDDADGQPRSGKGWRQTSSAGNPSSSPILRTSSLNKNRSGSTSSKPSCAGRLPTLWWLLMVTVGPPWAGMLSITSGYRVPCARNFI